MIYRKAAPLAWPLANCAALFLIIFGARLWLIAGFGSSLPLLDQWDGEAAFLLKPWFEGQLHLADLFYAHNEHRLFTSRLLTLLLVQWNGQWDAQVQMVVNAAGVSLLAVIIAVTTTKILGPAFRSIVFGALALWGALPYAQENTLWGFQSCFYFLIGFSLIGIWGFLAAPWSSRWWIGWLAVALACLSMGSGLLAPLAVLGLLVLRGLRDRKLGKRVWVTLLACVATALIAAHFRADVPYHQILKATSLAQWWRAFVGALAWPCYRVPALAIALYAPSLTLAWLYLSKRKIIVARGTRGVELLLATGLWIILQAAAIGYARGAVGDVPSTSRYMDVLALGSVVNGIALAFLWSAAHLKATLRRVVAIAGAGWLFIVVIGAIHLSYQMVEAQSGRVAYLRAEEQNIRYYLATGDRSAIDGSSGARVPYPDADRFATLLHDPTIQKILPAGARMPLRLDNLEAQKPFLLNGVGASLPEVRTERNWGSFTQEGATAQVFFQSQQFSTTFPYLSIEFTGALANRMSLHIKNTGTGRLTRVFPSGPFRNGWRSSYVAAPRRGIQILARDENESNWFAFREPQEVGRLSYFAARIILHGKHLFICGVGLWLFTVAAAHRPRRRLA